LILGALIPDLIDKPLLFLKLGSGRGISHSLLFILASCVILIFLLKSLYKNNNNNKNNIIVLSYIIGISSHLIIDLPEVPLL